MSADTALGAHTDGPSELLCSVGVGIERAGGRDMTKVFETHLSRINQLLEEAGVSAHRECRVLREPLDFRCPRRSFPGSWFTRLQRIQALCLQGRGGDLVAFASSGQLEDPDDDPIDEVLGSGSRSHLLCHAAEGYYVPVDMPQPLHDSEDVIPGGWLGSSNSLLEELVALSPSLGASFRELGAGRRLRREGSGFDLTDEALHAFRAASEAIPATARRPSSAASGGAGGGGGARSVPSTPPPRTSPVQAALDPDDPLAAEKAVWFALDEAARMSVKHGTALVLW